MSSIAPYRFTPEDLPELDAKTRNALQPLFDALNTTVQQLVNNANAAPQERTLTGAITATATTASVPIGTAPIAKPFSIRCEQIRRTDADDTTAPYLGAWKLTATGATLLFGGLTSGGVYSFTVTVR